MSDKEEDTLQAILESKEEVVNERPFSHRTAVKLDNEFNIEEAAAD